MDSWGVLIQMPNPFSDLRTAFTAGSDPEKIIIERTKRFE